MKLPPNAPKGARIIEQTDRITRRIDGECASLVIGLSREFGTDPTSIAQSVILLMLRQLAMIDIPLAAEFTRACADEISANYSDPDARQRRISISFQLGQRCNEKSQEIIDGFGRPQ